ncbi:hypothetical protein [Aeromicrobium chenweiae]|uniref:Uncharacterized protein n=1 Tax=Aeromicrobium chenweiae TaxID=2079793 RepID=A0A2S0WRP3_9ACTN|nr:hypothetical protein [Aeromicrobium chenweiae]AWB93904.1 hypothetical protein C3E78_17730 [Aeromicrobium chenweiae]TGN30949.1 hypothetical protein E4L97_15145 [Aeromicrobium chenweiae]
MMRTRVLAGLVAAAFVLAGCGSGGGDDDVSNLSAKKILAKSKAAAKSSDSLTVEGEGQTATSKLEVDMEFTDKTGEGSIAADDAKIELLSAGGKAYFRGGPELYSQLGSGSEDVIKMIGDKWILVDPSEPGMKSFAEFSSRDGFIDQLLSPDTTPTKTKPKKIEGVECVGLKTKTGTLYVDKKDARPIRLDPKGGSGSLTFDYDKVDAAKAPTSDEVLDLKSLS